MRMRVAFLVCSVALVPLVAACSGDDDDSGGDATAVAPAANRDHWHAALHANVCGEWLPIAPEFHNRSGETTRAGIHSHGDGRIHTHPTQPDEAGENAVLGKFFEFGGWSISEGSISVWDDETHTNGDACSGGEAGQVRWFVDGEEQTGDPGALRLEEGQEIVIAFAPPGVDLGAAPDIPDQAQG